MLGGNVHVAPNRPPLQKHARQMLASPLKLLMEPTRPTSNYDVLCGKTSYNKHGNEYFRKLIQKHRHVYRSTNIREEKRRIIEHIIDDVHRRGGQFLKDATTGEEISYTAQYEKVSHALRSARAPVSQGAVRTREEMAPNVTWLLTKQRELYLHYCRVENCDPNPFNASMDLRRWCPSSALPAVPNQQNASAAAAMRVLPISLPASATATTQMQRHPNDWSLYGVMQQQQQQLQQRQRQQEQQLQQLQRSPHHVRSQTGALPQFPMHGSDELSLGDLFPINESNSMEED